MTNRPETFRCTLKVEKLVAECRVDADDSQQTGDGMSYRPIKQTSNVKHTFAEYQQISEIQRQN
jgi:hypothetical protein